MSVYMSVCIFIYLSFFLSKKSSFLFSLFISLYLSDYFTWMIVTVSLILFSFFHIASLLFFLPFSIISFSVSVDLLSSLFFCVYLFLCLCIHLSFSLYLPNIRRSIVFDVTFSFFFFSLLALHFYAFSRLRFHKALRILMTSLCNRQSYEYLSWCWLR